VNAIAATGFAGGRSVGKVCCDIVHRQSRWLSGSRNVRDWLVIVYFGSHLGGIRRTTATTGAPSAPYPSGSNGKVFLLEVGCRKGRFPRCGGEG